MIYISHFSIATVTWGPNLQATDAFVDMPRTEADAKSQHFTMISDCSGHQNFLGKRYTNNDELTIMVYDVNGYIAGMQARVPDGLSNGYPGTSLRGHPFIKEGNNWYVTVYFVDPATICTTGRTHAQYVHDGTGTGLFIQNGTDPLKSIRIPHSEVQAKATNWGYGKCLPTMGKHYFHALSLDMSCDHFFPVFLLYNGGNLDAFGWAFKANIQSPRAEHPPNNTIAVVMDPVPRCISISGTLTTMHIFLNSQIQDNLCS
ncbi:hypothetical protein FSP39_002394 [Pinctada imbricata]|uniref:Uncharacterized protein n=1 Tax=Pinctada imbricata TaxID=66713 RepID=A0AA89CBT7_PINIB|nr:hypothetical protein FSP39_002394 [Pinctada imbricata]